MSTSEQSQIVNCILTPAFNNCYLKGGSGSETSTFP